MLVRYTLTFHTKFVDTLWLHTKYYKSSLVKLLSH